jgi:peptidyl-prolyl cis-trans isomerase C
MRSRILAGESLFELAGQYSIDAYGRQRSGDMGWLKEGSATKEIEQAIKNLQNNELSEVIKTDKGWHLVLIVNRKPSTIVKPLLTK